MQYQEANPYMTPFMNYTLTELATSKIGKKKKYGDIYPVYSVFTRFLEAYGIFVFGGTQIHILEGEHTDIQTCYITIDRQFPMENEFLFSQLYGYENAMIDIGIKVINEDAGCQFSFEYNLETKTCKLKRNSYGSVSHVRQFESFTEMMDEIKKHSKKYYGFMKIFNEEKA